MHELWHFYTWYSLGINQVEKLGKEKYNDLKEALTVLLNVEFRDLLPEGIIDAGYPQHKELRDKILKFWEKDRNIINLWNYLNDVDTYSLVNNNDLKLKIQELLGRKIAKFSLKGKGAVNYAYYVESEDGEKFIIKQERNNKEFQPQNDLITEAKVAKQLYTLELSTPTPRVVFVSEDPKMYGYKYIEGDLLREVWQNFTEDEKVNVCRKLGYFHGEIGKKFTKEMAGDVGIIIDMSADLHPEVSTDYNRLILDANVPENFKTLVKEARSIFDRTQDRLVFQFLHNDSHHENIIIKDKMISGIIDFGNAEYGEVTKEFSRYIRDFPNHFQYIVSAYEEQSGNKLSSEHLISNSLISGFIDIVDNYKKGGKSRTEAETMIKTYANLLKLY